jgi:hypothetical protein
MPNFSKIFLPADAKVQLTRVKFKKIKMKTLSYVIAFISLAFLTSCASYIISTSSLAEQLTGDTVSKGYLFAKDAVKGNDLKTITCIDKKGKEKTIAVTNRTGVRITKTDNSKVSFYFNTLLIKDSTIAGSKTHFINAKVTPIKFLEISKIEIME